MEAHQKTVRMKTGKINGCCSECKQDSPLCHVTFGIKHLCSRTFSEEPPFFYHLNVKSNKNPACRLFVVCPVKCRKSSRSWTAEIYRSGSKSDSIHHTVETSPSSEWKEQFTWREVQPIVASWFVQLTVSPQWQNNVRLSVICINTHEDFTASIDEVVGDWLVSLLVCQQD